jgi:hypothetical protein
MKKKFSARFVMTAANSPTRSPNSDAMASHQQQDQALVQQVDAVLPRRHDPDGHGRGGDRRHDARERRAQRAPQFDLHTNMIRLPPASEADICYRTAPPGHLPHAGGSDTQWGGRAPPEGDVMLRLIATSALVLLVGFAGICGSGKKAEPVTDEAFLWIATAAAKDANLTIDDFPATWESEPPDPDDEDDDDDEEDEIPESFSDECRELFESFDATFETGDSAEDDIPSAVSDDFSSPDGEGVSTEVEVFRTLDEASEGEEILDDAFGTCGDDMAQWIEDDVNKDAETEGEEFRVSNVEMLEWTERDLGDWARDWGFAVTYEFSGLTVDATIELTFVRAGRMNGTFSHFEIGDSDEVLVDSLREVFADRLATVDATLPE